MCLYGKVGVIGDLVSVYQFHSENLIKVLKNDFKLIINNYDHLAEPYKLAIKSGLFSEYELIGWEKRVLIPYMRYIIFLVMIFQDENYEKLMVLLKGKDADVLKKVQKTFKFKIFLLLYRIRLIKFIYNFNKKNEK